MDQAKQAILKVARSVLEELDVDLVLQRVLESARELTGARYAALGVLDESRTALGQFLTLGIDEPARRSIGGLPTGRGVLGELIRNPAPVRLADVGAHPCAYGFPVGHPPMRSFLGVPILISGRPYGNLYLADKQDEAEFSQDDQDSAMLLADFAGLAVDHARRYTLAEDRRAELQRMVSALDATIQIARAVGGETDLSAILQLVASRGRALVCARGLAIELLYGDQLEVAAGAGELPEGLIGRRVDLIDTVASGALRTRRTQRLSDELNRDRFDQHGLGHLGVSAEEGLIVPLVFRERPYGVLVAIDHLGAGTFSAEHEQLLEGFAASAATAVATAQAGAEERRLVRLEASEAERTRWARELHDETLQGLGSLRLMLSSAKRNGGPAALGAAVGQALEQIEWDIANLRALITELRPAALDDLGLDAAVTALGERATSGGLDVDVSIELAYEQGHAGERLAIELETAVYRIVQEALTNATKHGHAKRAVVEIVESDQEISLTIRDDGRGFDPSAKSVGFGLPGMHERTELLQGRLKVESTPGRGTTVTARLPVRRRPAIGDPATAPPVADWIGS